ncbi:MAG: riboflavin synthase [Rhizobiales bacterium]|nr:riboflavin synthase [Hyphomicrobiales bacterium]NRB12820.1 riboflavin synthase [Hyphomicrobiales bacterium]
MFTGLVSDIGEIINLKRAQNGIAKFEITSNYDFESIAIGASICCSGACMTVVSKHNNHGKTSFWIDVSEESLGLTTLKNWQLKTQINLERSLKIGDELGGHMVSGHVDGVATITDLYKEADSLRFTFEVAPQFAQFIAPKGSVALDGTSLTVNEVDVNKFGINIIPHTLEKTTWSDRKLGDLVNFEVDQMARYAARILQMKDNI